MNKIISLSRISFYASGFNGIMFFKAISGRKENNG